MYITSFYHRFGGSFPVNIEKISSELDDSIHSILSLSDARNHVRCLRRKVENLNKGVETAEKAAVPAEHFLEVN